MKKLILLVVLGVLVSACQAPVSEGAIQTALAETAAAQPTETPSPLPSDTPTPTETVDPFELTKAANQTQNAAHAETAAAQATNLALTPTKTPTRTPLPTATPSQGARTNPYARDDTIALIQGGTIHFTMHVEEYLRGDEAWQKIYAANRFNDPAPDGLEFILLRIKVVYNGEDKGPLEINEAAWSSVSKGRIFDTFDAFVCCLDPEFDFTLFAGGEAEGWVALLVSVDDPAPLIAIGLHSDGTGGIFISTVP